MQSDGLVGHCHSYANVVNMKTELSISAGLLNTDQNMG